MSEALSGCNVLRMSIHDATGATAWNGGAPLTAAEHDFLLDALDCFALEPARNMVEQAGENGIGLAAFAARDPRGALHGALLLQAELVTLNGRPGDRQMPGHGDRLLRQLALRLGNGAPQVTTDATTTGFGNSSLTLYVQQLLKLGAAGRTRRFEVLLRTRNSPSGQPVLPQELIAEAEDPASGGQLDRAVLGELCRWLIENRAQFDVEPAAFSINLSTGALLDETFPAFVAHTLRETRLNPRLIGFEVRESQCRAHFAAVQRFLERCEEIGCHAVIDDFTFHSDVLGLLRARAVRMLKICPSLTLDGLADKVSQAQVAAISHGSRVLGIHSAAKRIESAKVRQWLAAAGVEFAQGYLFESPIPLSDLGAARMAAPHTRL
ncbi:MAG: EAL domain-containing protein [Pseudomonadota bacterium]